MHYSKYMYKDNDYSKDNDFHRAVGSLPLGKVVPPLHLKSEDTKGPISDDDVTPSPPVNNIPVNTCYSSAPSRDKPSEGLTHFTRSEEHTSELQSR